MTSEPPIVGTDAFEALQASLFTAIEQGDVQRLQQVDWTHLHHVYHNASIGLVYLALLFKQVHVVVWLVEESARRGVDVASGWRGVHVAALRGEVEKLVRLSDEELGVLTVYGRSVLHAAVVGEQVEVIEYLVGKRGFDVLHRDRGGNSSLGMAAMHGCDLAVRQLVECAGPLSAQLPEALVLATRSGHVHVMEQLVGLGADVNSLDVELLVAAAESGRVEVIDSAVRLGADPQAALGTRRGALHAVMAMGSGADVIKRLVQVGVPLDGADQHGWTPLHAAFRSPGGCRVLLELGADRWTKDSAGRTPRDAARNSKAYPEQASEVVELLDSYFPIVPSMAQVLLGLTAGGESTTLGRLAGNSAFEPKVLALVNCFLTGKDDRAFEQLAGECSWVGSS